MDRGRSGGRAPDHRKAVRVAHVERRNVAATGGDERRAGGQKPLHALVELAPAEADDDAIGELELPGAALAERERGRAQPGLQQARIKLELGADMNL